MEYTILLELAGETLISENLLIEIPELIQAIRDKKSSSELIDIINKYF